MPNTSNLRYKYRLGNPDFIEGMPVPTRGGIETVTTYGNSIKSDFKVGSRDSEIPLRSESLRPTGELNDPIKF